MCCTRFIYLCRSYECVGILFIEMKKMLTNYKANMSNCNQLIKLHQPKIGNWILFNVFIWAVFQFVIKFSNVLRERCKYFRFSCTKLSICWKVAIWLAKITKCNSITKKYIVPEATICPMILVIEFRSLKRYLRKRCCTIVIYHKCENVLVLIQKT